MVGREKVTEKLTWKVSLGNKVSQETGPEETEELPLSFVNIDPVRKEIVKYLSIFM